MKNLIEKGLKKIVGDGGFGSEENYNIFTYKEINFFFKIILIKKINKKPLVFDRFYV